MLTRDTGYADIQKLLTQQLIAVQTALDFNKEISLRVQKAIRPEDGRGRRRAGPGKAPEWCCQSERPGFTYLEKVDPDQEMPDPELLMTIPLLNARVQEKSQRQISAGTPYSSQGSAAQDRDRQQTRKKARVNHFFPHVDEIKHTVTESLRGTLYNVEDLYKDSGIFQLVARHDLFHSMALLVIAMNTIWIAIETDYNHAEILCEAPMVFQVMDNFFCSFFLLEIVIRFMAFRKKFHAFRDGWFTFDFSLVALMIWENWVLVFLYLMWGVTSLDSPKGSSLLRLFRLVRLVRVARAGRLLSSAPELLLLAKGILAAVRSVLAVLCLLSLVIYVFAVIFTQLLAGTEVGAGSFDNVPQSFNTLMLQVLCGASTDFINKLLVANWMYYVLMLLFLLVALLTIMNMLIGILCGVVADITESEKEASFIAEVERQIRFIAEDIDVDNNGTIDKDEFETILKDPKITQRFYELGVDIVGAADFAKFIFTDVDELSFGDFTHLVSQFRGSKVASIKDIMEMRRFVAMEFNALGAKIMNEEDEIRKIQNQMVQQQKGNERRQSVFMNAEHGAGGSRATRN